MTPAVLASTDAQIPNQDLLYVYDALGNRTIENGVTTDYTPNNLNQYVQVGTTKYVFDLNGNLVQGITLQATNPYNYSIENRPVSANNGAVASQLLFDPIGGSSRVITGGVVTCHIVDPLARLPGEPLNYAASAIIGSCGFRGNSRVLSRHAA